MNTNDSVGTRLGQIMDESARLGRAAWAEGALYLVALTAAGAAIDQMSDIGSGNLAFSLLSFVLGYVLTVSVLRGGGLRPEGEKGGFGSYFGLSLLSGLGIVLGSLLLVIPGLVLFVRWSPAYGYLLAEGVGMTDSLSKAWNQTGAHFWPLALALLPPVAINLGALAVYVLGSDEAGAISLPMSLLANGMIAAAGVGITVIGLAGYALLRDRGAGLAEVFA